MYFQDLSTYSYHLSFPLEGVRCVGWLDADHEYAIGHSPEWLAEQLRLFTQHRSQTFDVHVNVMRGIHPCNLCGERIQIITKDGRSQPLGMSEIWIPCNPGWFAAPSLVIHYIEEHRYMPPSTFMEAVQSLRTDRSFLGQDVYDRLLREKMGG